MKREGFPERRGWCGRCEEVGFNFHTFPEGQYWQEGAGYQFTAGEIDRLEEATGELHAMCMDLVADVVRIGDYGPYNLSIPACELIAASWQRKDPSLYGRFDLAYDGTAIKMLEYNADTPTSLLEASVVQWNWLEDHKLPDQFNSIHEKLVAWWQQHRKVLGPRVWLAAMDDAGKEDWGVINYLFDTVVQAGFNASWLPLEQVGFTDGKFVDVKGEHITTIFKLYPWEWLVKDAFAQHIGNAGTMFIEPAWKMLLSNKAILPLLWQRHPGHPLLLPAYFDRDNHEETMTGKWARKPILAREGANVSCVENGVRTELDGASANPMYDLDGYVLQQWFEVPSFDGFRPVIGSWVIGDESAGMGVREDRGLVSGNNSFFVPHYFEE